ncbi:MAG: helix-turn-helix domain-containing protein [Myxococcota bacterium]|nr:helix-turn-helix domain-containing protein [Myxococcota bacterium]
MAARKTTRSKKKSTARKPSGGASQRGSGRKKRARRKAQPRPPASRPARKRSTGPVAFLADWVTSRIEHATAGALRTAVEVGGAGLAGWLPDAGEARRAAGNYVRELRELAGLTREELAEALELSDRSVLGAVEAGTATLSFELILRLAAILARHDPVPVVTRLVRTYNPVLWEMLEDWGVGGLPLQFEREREFLNVLRSRDEARALDDEDFARVLAFTREAFHTALHFTAKHHEGEHGAEE